MADKVMFDIWFARLTPLFVLPMLACFGCNLGASVPMGEVTGKVVNADGEPMGGCVVIYAHEESGTGGSGEVRDDGSYSILYRGNPGLPANFTYRISLKPKESEPFTEEEYDKYMNAPPRVQKQMDQARQEALADVPSRYRDLRTSGLEFHVQTGKQVNNITVIEDDDANSNAP